MQTNTDRRNSRLYAHRPRARVLTLLGDKCKHCGEDDVRCLQIDHINGGGRKELAGFKSRTAYLKNVTENIERYQLLCANCNWRKRWDLRETTRKRDPV